MVIKDALKALYGIIAAMLVVVAAIVGLGTALGHGMLLVAIVASLWEIRVILEQKL